MDCENHTVTSGLNIVLPLQTAELLRNLGYQNISGTDSVAVTQFISIDPDTGLIEAVSDPRKDGHPAGL